MTPKNLWWETHNDTQRKSSSESERTGIEYTWAISHSKERSHWIQSAVTDWQEDLQGTWKKMYLHEQINIWANIFLQRKENWMFCYIILLVCYLISTVCGQVFFAIVWFAAWQGRTFLTTTLNPKHLKLYVCLWILITLSSVQWKTACKKTLLFLCLSIEPSDNFLKFFL